ncbi:MAG: hypothetical protein J6J57_04990 [Alistipes sp.]|nr:hypothetical protein [Alistipes sp.]
MAENYFAVHQTPCRKNRYLWDRFIEIYFPMTEKDKMLRQMLYDANNDTDLIGER